MHDLYLILLPSMNRVGIGTLISKQLVILMQIQQYDGDVWDGREWPKESKLSPLRVVLV